MDFLETTIFTTTAGIEPVTGVLLNLGINGFVVEDAQDFNDFLEDTTIYWDYVDDDLMKLKDCETNIKIYLPQNPQGNETLLLVRQALEGLKSRDANHAFGRLELTLNAVKAEDWENNWKQYFKPFCVGEHFLIKPSWEEVKDTNGRTILEIDPASSFGTGSHTTTQLCIQQLEHLVHKGDEVLDMGCGSGILGIAALLLGANHVTAVDIDLNSVRTAKENALKNHIAPDKLDAYCGNITQDEALFETVASRSYDVIAANIVADVIISMRHILYKLLKEDGRMVVSGIICERTHEVADALVNAGFAVLEQNEQNDWASITLKKA